MGQAPSRAVAPTQLIFVASRDGRGCLSTDETVAKGFPACCPGPATPATTTYINFNSCMHREISIILKGIEKDDELVPLNEAQRPISVNHKARFTFMTQDGVVARQRFSVVHQANARA